MSNFLKNVHFWAFENVSKNGFPGQTTMLTTPAAKFCVEPRSPFSNISHHDPKTSGKRLIIVSWPECRPEFPSDGDGNDGVKTTLPYGLSPIPSLAGMNYPVRESFTSIFGLENFSIRSRWTIISSAKSGCP